MWTESASATTHQASIRNVNEFAAFPGPGICRANCRNNCKCRMGARPKRRPPARRGWCTLPSPYGGLADPEPAFFFCGRCAGVVPSAPCCPGAGPGQGRRTLAALLAHLAMRRAPSSYAKFCDYLNWAPWSYAKVCDCWAWGARRVSTNRRP